MPQCGTLVNQTIKRSSESLAQVNIYIDRAVFIYVYPRVINQGWWTIDFSNPFHDMPFFFEKKIMIRHFNLFCHPKALVD